MISKPNCTYEPTQKVGEGTYATVYKAWAVPHQDTNAKKQKVNKEMVALKKIKPIASQNGLDISAIRELRFLKTISHPNIIKLRDCYSHNSNLFLVLEILHADLEMIIKDRMLLFGAGDIKSWMLMLMRGLYHCHRMFILHRVSYFRWPLF